VSALAQVVTTLGPGVHRDLSYDAYAAIPALRHSVLHEMKRSPAHAVAKQLEHSKGTKPMVLGSALHCAVLEAHLFPSKFAVRPMDHKTGQPLKLTTKAGKEWAESIPAGVEILDGDMPEKVNGMVGALRAHALASLLLFGDGPGSNEVSVVWDEDGLLCMRRLDRMARVKIPSGWSTWTGTAIVELKTTVDARPWAFASQAERLGYFGAAEWSLRGADAVAGKAPRRYFFVAVETALPFAVQVHEPTVGDLAAAREENDILLAKYRECASTNHWPSYPEGISVLRRPGWAQGQSEEE
jgi:hypothetical protein